MASDCPCSGARSADDVPKVGAHPVPHWRGSRAPRSTGLGSRDDAAPALSDAMDSEVRSQARDVVRVAGDYGLVEAMGTYGDMAVYNVTGSGGR